MSSVVPSSDTAPRLIAVLLVAAVGFVIVEMFVRVLTMAAANHRDLDELHRRLDRLNETRQTTAREFREATEEERQRVLQRLEDLLHQLQEGRTLDPLPAPQEQDSSQDF